MARPISVAGLWTGLLDGIAPEQIGLCLDTAGGDPGGPGGER
ncbi:MAG: hypothetical protein V9G14_09725 [Cypionkella sp.]